MRLFAYRLAAHLGIWDVHGLERQMSHGQLLEWLAYFTVEPFGDARADWRAAMQASVVANVNRRQASRQFQPRDFMPRFDQPNKAKSPEAMLEVMKMAMAASGKGQK